MAAVANKKAHVLAVPVPAEGHMWPLFRLCRKIAKHGIKVTFVNAESVHQRLVAAAETRAMDEDGSSITLISVPDGIKPDDDPTDSNVLVSRFSSTLASTLSDLMERINISNPNERISCVIADQVLGWALDTAERMGAEAVRFSTSSMATSTMLDLIPKLLQEDNLDTNGSIKKFDSISLSDEIPAWRNDNLPWSSPTGDLKAQRKNFEFMKTLAPANKPKWLLCNTCYELEPAACDLNPNFLPIGPLHLAERSCSDSRLLSSKDASCLSWLDSKPAGSVVYVSFGSIAVCSQQQLDELALGLELSGRAFLWVVRKNLTAGSRSQIVYPDGFLERVSKVGKIVEWAPQTRVLSHPAIACFVSHCGWNSILEGVSQGVPFLCWPSSTDQFHHTSYISDKFEIGLRINHDENGVRSRYEIKNKIDMLLSKNKYKENALKMKEKCVNSINKGGSSYKNLEAFIDDLISKNGQF